MMYGLHGGCTTLFHLFVKHPLLVAFLGLAGLFANASNSAPGDRHGLASSLTNLERELVKQNPSMAAEVLQLRKEFDKTNPQLTEEDVRKVLAMTDACTDLDPKSIMKNPDDRREAAWLLHLDAYFKNRHGPPRKK